MKNASMDMCEGPLLKKLILYTVPIILSGLLQLLFNAADLVVVGRFSGSVSVAAVGATGSISNLIINLFIGLSVGAGVSTAQAIGAGNHDEVHRIVHTAIPLALAGGLILTVVGVLCAEQFLIWMATPEDVLPLSSLYMRIYFCGMVSSMLYNFGSAILRAAGDTSGPLRFLTIAGVINVILNLFFVIVFHMDVAGVALATAISQTISAILVILALMKRTDACHLAWSELRFDGKVMRKIVRIGLPAGIQGSLFSISNVLIQSSINSFGSLVMSGSAAASNIEGFVYITMNAFHHTSLNFVGQNIGARKVERVKLVLRDTLLLVTGVGLVTGFCAYFFAPQLLSIYITDSPEAIQYGVTRMAYLCLPYFLCGLMDTLTGSMRGMGSSVPPMIITVVGVCVMRIAWIETIFQIPQFHTLGYLFISYPISWGVTSMVQFITYCILLRKVKRKFEQEAIAELG